jgi:hypothetical protein
MIIVDHQETVVRMGAVQAVWRVWAILQARVRAGVRAIVLKKRRWEGRRGL